MKFCGSFSTLGQSIWSSVNEASNVSLVEQVWTWFKSISNACLWWILYIIDIVLSNERSWKIQLTGMNKQSPAVKLATW